MNKYNSIIEYRKRIESSLLIKTVTKIKVLNDLNKAVTKIKTLGFKKIEEKYKNFDPPPGYSKYLNLKPWMLDNVWRAYILGLNKSSPKNILDIGTGNGYFPFLCQSYGHKLRTIDIDSNPLFNALIELLDVQRLSYALKANESIPEFDIKFDLVTGFHTYFNGHRTESVWTSKEWNYFLKDIKNNHCHPNAEAYFIINKEHDRESYFTNELKNYFLESGAEIDENRVYFKNLNSIQ